MSRVAGVKRKLLVLVFPFVLGIAGCAGTQSRLEPLSVTLADIRPVQIGLLEQEYAIKIRVQNPNNADIRIQGLSHQIDLNGKLFAKGVSRQSISLPGFGEVVLDATAVGNLGAIMSQVVQIQRSGAPDSFSYRLKGKLASTQASMPFDSQGSIELPELGGAATE
jgi:LEA14-like dessication related protein